jgi:hypothetical protein
MCNHLQPFADGLQVLWGGGGIQGAHSALDRPVVLVSQCASPRVLGPTSRARTNVIERLARGVGPGWAGREIPGQAAGLCQSRGISKVISLGRCSTSSEGESNRDLYADSKESQYEKFSTATTKAAEISRCAVPNAKTLLVSADGPPRTKATTEGDKQEDHASNNRIKTDYAYSLSLMVIPSL